MRNRLLASAGVVGLFAGTALAFSTTASAVATHRADDPNKSYTSRVILSGSSLSHDVDGSSQPLTKPDDIAFLGGKLFVAFQNGVGSQGEPTSSGNSASTLVELTRGGHLLRQWDLTGKIDGLGADQASGLVGATVNEDGNSSLYTINPTGPNHGDVTHFLYDQDPLPHGGGTDAVTFSGGKMFVSASAPTAADGPAAYSVSLHRPTSPGGTGVADTATVFSDNANATPANQGAPSQLALTDPDSSTVVPWDAPRFARDFMLDSQGDQEQIYISHPAIVHQSLSVLQLSQAVDDTSFVTSDEGVLFVTDSTNDSVDVVTGPFHVGDALAAVTPCGSNSAPSVCPAAGFPANYLGIIDLNTGAVSPLSLSGASLTPQGGMVFVGHGDNQQGEDRGDNTDS